MAKGGGLFGALLGAGGVSAWYNGGDVLGPLRGLPGFGGFGTGGHYGPASQWSGGSGREMDDLKKLVEQLSRDLGRQQAGFTIVTNPGGKGGSNVVVVSTVVAGVGIVYLRFVRGWRLADMMYVTRSSLTKSLSQVSSGVESVRAALQQQVESVKSRLEGRLEHLRSKQAESKEAQDAMAEHLRTVGNEVDATRAEMHSGLSNVQDSLDSVGSSVRELEANLDEISFHQQTANEGIKLLCNVVGDLMSKAGYRMASVVELDKYVKRPRVSGSPRVQGLEGLLNFGDSSSTQSQGRRSSREAPRVALSAGEPAVLLQAASMRRLPDMDRTSTI